MLLTVRTLVLNASFNPLNFFLKMYVKCNFQVDCLEAYDVRGELVYDFIRLAVAETICGKDCSG